MARLSLLFAVLALAAHAAFGAPPCPYSTTVTNFASHGKLGGNGLFKAFHGHSITKTTLASTSSNPASSTSSNPASSTPSNPSSSNNPSTSSNSAGGSGSVSSSDQQAYLDDHNTFRQPHGANNLIWSNELSSTAQAWANKCVFQHSGAGENLAAGTGDMSIASAIKMWTDEASSYDPNNPQPSHFTQVVWKATTQLGCAVATCPAGSIFSANYGTASYYVCHYSPPGNVEGEYSQNVQV